MHTLTPQQFQEYLTNPLATDEKVREWAKVPDDRYYTVSVWPENLAGIVRVNNNTRVVKAKKISKSN